MELEKIISEKKGTVVDVRTAEEFRGGNVMGSVNIPLREIAMRIDEIRKLEKPIVLCCASGTRSSMATQALMDYDIECINAGSWTYVNYFQPQNVNL